MMLEKVVKTLQLLTEKKELIPNRSLARGWFLFVPQCNYHLLNRSSPFQRTIAAAEGGFVAETSAAKAWNPVMMKMNVNGAGVLRWEVPEGQLVFVCHQTYISSSPNSVWDWYT